jgi:chromosome segregation ATPase
VKIKVFSRGKAVIDADHEYQEPMIREAIDQRAVDVGGVIIDYTDTERSNISYDQYAIVTGDGGLILWQGWLTGGGRPAPELWQEAGE